MPVAVSILISTVIAYLIGSLSPAIMISKINKKDIMNNGSKNAGSTNVLRVVGPKAAAIVFVLDVAKGFLTVFLIAMIAGQMASYFAAIAVIVGHCFSIFHKFKAGKGVAPGFGVMLAVDWRIALCVLAVAAIFFLISKRVSVGSLCAAFSLPIVTYFFVPEFFLFAFVIAALVIFTHRANIKRLMNNEEAPLSFGNKEKKQNKETNSQVAK